MKPVFQKYVGHEIGINYKDLAKFHVARLVDACDSYFSIEKLDSEIVRIHYKYNQVIMACENTGGIDTAEFFSSKKVNFVIQVNHLVVGGGSGVGIGVGVGI